MKNVVAALCLLASPALAQITPQQVLESWQQFSNRNEAGFAFERQEAEAAEITLYNVTLGGGADTGLPWLTLAALEGGAVRISIAEDLTSKTAIFEGAPEYLSKSEMALNGLSIVVTGVPEDISYQLSLESFTHENNSDWGNGKTFSKADLHDLSATLRHRGNPLSGDVITVQATIGSWVQDGSTTLEETLRSREHKSVANIQLEGAFNLAQLDALTFRFTGNDFSQSQDNAGLGNALITLGSINFRVSGAPENLHFHMNLQDAGFALNLAPVIGMDMNFGFESLLVSSTAEPQLPEAGYTWQFETQLQGLVLSPDTWAELDPSAALPHDTGHFLATLNGVSQPPEGLNMAPSSPFIWLADMQSLTLEKLDIRFAGLALLARGTMSFQKGARRIFSLVEPNGGQIDLQMRGAQSLLAGLSSVPMTALALNELSNLLESTAPSNQSPDDLNLTILFDEHGGVSVK